MYKTLRILYEPNTKMIILLFPDLYGKNNLEAAQIDIILDTLLDLNNRGLRQGKPYFREDDQQKQVRCARVKKVRKFGHRKKML